MSFPAELEYCGGKVGGTGRPNAGMAPPHHRAPSVGGRQLNKQIIYIEIHVHSTLA